MVLFISSVLFLVSVQSAEGALSPAEILVLKHAFPPGHVENARQVSGHTATLPPARQAHYTVVFVYLLPTKVVLAH